MEWSPGDYFSLICVIMLSLFAIFYCVKNSQENKLKKENKVQPSSIYEQKIEETIPLNSDLKL